MKLVSEIVGQNGAFEFLCTVDEKSGIFDSNALYDAMNEAGVADPETLRDGLVENGLLNHHSGGYSLSSVGAKTLLLLRAVNGEDVELVYSRLAAIYPEMRHYELVREGMTLKFVHDLYSRPSFRRLLICSPLINMEHKTLGRLAQALRWSEAQSGNRTVEFLVVHGAFEGDDERNRPFRNTLDVLESLGADIHVYPGYPRLHVKLYIREPWLSGGVLSAAFGSENLTRSRNVELGIRVTNDSEMITNLVSNFFEIYNVAEQYT